MKHIIECCHCHKKFETKSCKAIYCSRLCRKIEITRKQFTKGTNFVECKICGLRGRQLNQHIEKVHNITLNEYCQMFGLGKKDLQTQDLHDQMSAGIKRAHSEGKCGFQAGGYNPAQNEDTKTGRNSIWSMNFKGYDGLSDEEKIEKISDICDKL